MKTPHQIKRLLVSLLLLAALSANAYNTWYVDSTAAAGGSGTSWASAFNSLSTVASHVGAGDLVYISGGASGSVQVYNTGTWAPVGGSSGSIITYKIGQDSSHNGTAVFYTASGSSPGLFLSPVSHIAIVGDAGDGARHFRAAGVNTVMYWTTGSYTDIRLAYIDFGAITSNGGNPEDVLYANSISAFEFDHNYVDIASPTGNAFSYMVTTDSSWDGTKIHDNTFYALHSFAIGPDIFEFGGSTGYSIYNNTVHSVVVTAQGQHQDFWQDTGGSSDIKIYNNYLDSLGNSCMFADGYYGGFTGLYIYNNIGEVTSPVADGWFPSGITVVPDGYTSQNPNRSFSDVYVFNNLMADMGAGNPSGAGVGYTVSGQVGNNGWPGIVTFTGCNVYNNTGIKCAAANINFEGGSGDNSADNPLVTPAGGMFYRFSPYSTGNDYHLSPCDTTFKGQGYNLTSIVGSVSDKDGVPRPASGAWDIGPYVWLTPPTVTVSVNANPPYLYDTTSSSLTFTLTANEPFPVAYAVTLLIGGQQGGNPSYAYANWHSPPPTDFTVSGYNLEVAPGVFSVNFNAGDTTKTITVTGTGTANPQNYDQGYLILYFTVSTSNECGYNAGSTTQIEAYIYPN